MGSRATRGHVSHRIGETLGGSELTIHLIDARTLSDARAFDRAIQILDAEPNLAVLFLALKSIPKRRREQLQEQRVRAATRRLSDRCSPSLLGLNLMTLLRVHTEDGEVVVTDATEGFSPLFSVHQKRFMEYFQRTAEHRGRIAMGSVRIIQSMQLAVTLKAVENFNLDATLEMRGDAARDSTAGGDPLWVVAGLPVGDREPAYMTIAHRSEGPRADCAVCPDGDHVSAIICLGRTWVQRSCRRAGAAPRVVTVEEEV